MSAGNRNSVFFFVPVCHLLYQLSHPSKPQETKIFTNIDAYAMNIIIVEMLIGLKHNKDYRRIAGKLMRYSY